MFGLECEIAYDADKALRLVQRRLRTNSEDPTYALVVIDSNTDDSSGKVVTAKIR